MNVGKQPSNCFKTSSFVFTSGCRTLIILIKVKIIKPIEGWGLFSERMLVHEQKVLLNLLDDDKMTHPLA